MMKSEIKGLVMEIEQNHCLIMTHAGEFRRIGKPTGQVEVGQEITAFANTWIDRLRPLALVASLLLMVAVAWSVYQWKQPAVVAYVSLDINPSIELGIDSQSRVIKADGLNADGRKLLQMEPVIGKNIYTAMSELVSVAIEKQYINAQKENLVFTAIELEPQAPAHVVEEKQIYQAINQSLDSAKQSANVKVVKTQAEARQAAHKLGVSTGRYLLIEKEIKKDKNIQPQDLVKKSLNELGAKQWSEKTRRQKDNKKTSLQIRQPQVLGPQWIFWSQGDKDKQTQQIPALWTQWNKENKQIQYPSGPRPQWNEEKKQIQQQPVLWPQWNGTMQERPAKTNPKVQDQDAGAKDGQNDSGNRDKQNQSVKKGRTGKSYEGWNHLYPGRTNNRPGQTDHDHKKYNQRNGRDD